MKYPLMESMSWALTAVIILLLACFLSLLLYNIRACHKLFRLSAQGENIKICWLHIILWLLGLYVFGPIFLFLAAPFALCLGFYYLYRVRKKTLSNLYQIIGQSYVTHGFTFLGVTLILLVYMGLPHFFRYLGIPEKIMSDRKTQISERDQISQGSGKPNNPFDPHTLPDSPTKSEEIQ